MDKVKRSENGVINDPFSLSRDHKLRDALALMQKYRISGVPITDKSGKLVGILTNRDLRFETDFDRSIDEVMTKTGLITAREGTTLEEAKKILAAHRIEKLPIVDKDFKLKGLITIKDIEKVIKYPNSAKDSKGRLLCGAAIGAGADCIERASALVKAGVGIYEYLPGFIHAKNYLCDDIVGMVGTINMDYRSLVHHFEGGVWMYNTACLKDIRRDFEDTFKVCEQMTADNIQQTIPRRIASAIGSIFSPLL